jgi:hypothetical protein
VKVTNVFLTTIFKVGLQPYLRLITSGMIRDTLIKHKETAIICEESGPVMANYNTLITQLESKLVAQPTVTYIFFKLFKLW